MYQYKKTILVIGTMEIYQTRMLSWTEYIDKMRYQDNTEWITLLKVAVDIFRGEIKGLALLPDTKERRELALIVYMRNLITTTV